MPIWHKDIELSKYSKYKAKNGLSKNGTSSKHARVACLLAGVLLGGLHLLACACIGFACALGQHKSRVVMVMTVSPS